MKKHIIQQGKAQCRREFTIDGDIGEFSDDRLSQLADKLEVDWVIDSAAPCVIESVEIKEIDPATEIDCAEFECLGNIKYERATIDGKEAEDFTVKMPPDSVNIIVADPPFGTKGL